MALELLRGRTLQAILGERGPLPWREALALVERVAEGLHHAHERGIVHRDVKPANVMVLESGEPKIMDFGIAKVEASQLTAAGQLFGTPLYMSPEQALARTVDARSDIFSLGAMLYEVLTGRRAFAGDSVHGIVVQVIQSDPPLPSSLRTGIPGEVDGVVMRCLAKEPAQRYPSGRALAEDARAILGGAPPRARAEPPPADAAATLVSPRLPMPRERATEPRGRGAASGKLLLAGVLLAAAIGAGYLARGFFVPPDGPAASRVTSLLTGRQPARVSLDFGHSLRSGMLRVWVDDEAMIEADLDSRVTKQIAGLKLRKGTWQDSFEVEPGRHEIRVRVSWGDNVKQESIWANFEAGSTRRLEARLRGVGGLQDLSLKWR
jgi:serine/threonine-protein kinase